MIIFSWVSTGIGTPFIRLSILRAPGYLTDQLRGKILSPQRFASLAAPPNKGAKQTASP